ncbi:hypothetical protein [Alicyclobacillus fructus]|uniref:hypothetical protein n=1 Tax=Alicyclobacillus fructus TaxID=2816082 RepID=UPI001A8E7188|nr:hypothetical protein [Alicyclobacillus fructus]
MDRPTSILRQLLILELIQAHIAREFACVKSQMRADGLHIVERQDGDMDIRIKFRVDDRYDEAVFMRKMLEAEAANRAKRTGMISRYDQAHLPDFDTL